MSSTKLTFEKTVSAMRLSIADGIFATVFGNLTASVFLPAFALVLGASALQIGFLASLPFFGNIAQLGGSYLVERFNQRKWLAVVFSSFARLLWIPVVVLSIVLADTEPALLLAIIIGIVILYQILAAGSNVSWLSWMVSFVPDEIRGRYFGLRNALVGVFNITFTLLGGWFLDWHSRGEPVQVKLEAFEMLFAFAIVCGLVSELFLIKQPEPHTINQPSRKLRELYRDPLHQPNFRRLLKFAMLWSFVVNLAAPFYLVYMLQDLHMSYTAVAVMTVISAFADLVGMWIWGHISDHVGNKPVMVIAAVAVSTLASFWFFTAGTPVFIIYIIPLLHLLAGFFWAGYNLCSVNLLFRLAPREGNSTYFAYWAAFNGLAAGIGAVTGGVLSNHMTEILAFFSLQITSVYKTIFLISGLSRFGVILLLRGMREPKGTAVTAAVRVLLNIKSWATVMGFHPVLHLFIPRPTREDKPSPYWPLWRFRRTTRLETEAMDSV